jgi:hypothetical protein
MNKIYPVFISLLLSINAHAYSTGLPLPPISFASGQIPITVNVIGTYPITVAVSGKTPFTNVRVNYSTNNVTTTAYTQLVASTSQAATAMEVFDSSGQTLFFAFGGAGSEVNKVLDYPGGNGFIPLAIPAGTRLSITAVSGAATSGELDLNLYQ